MKKTSIIIQWAAAVAAIRDLSSKIKIKASIAAVLSVIIIVTGSCAVPTAPVTDDSNTDAVVSEEQTDNGQEQAQPEQAQPEQSATVDLSSLPEYTDSPFVIINDNQPAFSAAELTTVGYESYSELDSLGRCGTAVASCGREIMPSEDEERGSISSIKPSGWVQAKYDSISGKYLYNRSHLIGWQLSAENANRKNLITGTKYFNVSGMLPFENMVADYIRETDNHVAYRITPIYNGNELVCRGVQMEAYSVEDEGEGICFNVFCYNVQPGITIDYATGRSTSAVLQDSTEDAAADSTVPSSVPSDDTGSSQTKTRMVYMTKYGRRYHRIPDCGNTKTAWPVPIEVARVSS